MKNKKEKYYILYKYNSFINDLEYIKEYNQTKDIEEDFNIKNARQYITKDIENIKTLLKDKYVIIKEES